MHASPRSRRLRNDLVALEQLRRDSSIFSFTAHGNPPHHYQIILKGRSLCRDRERVRPLEAHRVEIKLGASYPRTMPEIRWITPIYHPNISEIGMVCLGGYGTHWVPSLQLDELCAMLWDMARFHNYDIRSPYNRDAALWAANQEQVRFPTDIRPLRDLRAALGRIDPNPPESEAVVEEDPSTVRHVGSNNEGITRRILHFARHYTLIFNRGEETPSPPPAPSVNVPRRPVANMTKVSPPPEPQAATPAPVASEELTCVTTEVSSVTPVTEPVEMVFVDVPQPVAGPIRPFVDPIDEDIIIIA